jgi:hypothetical protein
LIFVISNIRIITEVFRFNFVHTNFRDWNSNKITRVDFTLFDSETR